MRKLFRLAGLLAMTGVMASCSSEKTTANYEVIPIPQEISAIAGGDFTLANGTQIVYPAGNEMMKRNAEFLADYLKQNTGNTYSVVEGTEGKGNILLTLGATSEKPEGYQLTVNADGVVIAGASEAGVFYGIQTLRKSIPVVNGSTPVLTAVEINDYPRFDYRGIHFDVARHYFTMDEVKNFIDMMALHNMNVMHWHLTEDQGWRLEIKKYPLLTEIGSKRTETVIGRNSGKYDGKPYGGYYTQDDAREIVAYAAERFITVIPEIDLPGHMQGALAAYPNLGCTGGPYEVWREWGVSEEVLCAGNDSVLTFIEDVLTEVMDIFPYEYIHIGGDECPKIRWTECPKCQARIKALGIKGDSKHSKEEYLQSYIINHAEKFLNANGRQIIGWDEILEGGLAPNATVMSWRGEAGGIEAAKQGHDVIMTPNTYLYFDYYQSTDTDNEPLAIGGYLPLERVYNYEPMPASLTPEEQKHIVGVQANHWTEYIPTLSQLQYMALPRWAALAEVQWTNPSKKHYDEFLQRLKRLVSVYDQQGYNYAKHIYDAKVNFISNPTKGTVDVTAETIDNAPVYYTVDGSIPTTASLKLDSVVSIKENCVVTVAAIRPSGSSRPVSERIAFSKSTNKPIVANLPVNKQYEFNGVSTLVDGLKGNGNYKTGRWIAFYRNDMDVTVDMVQPTEISSVAITTNVEKGDWIMDTRGITVQVSENGTDFTTVASEAYPAMTKDDRNGLYEHKLTFSPVTAKFVRVIALSEQAMPEWHGGKGKPSFLFVDELTID